MKLESFYYNNESGWSVEKFPEIDSEKSVVIIFGASSYIDSKEPIDNLCQAYPLSKIIGCSTAGEIFNTEIFDESLSVAVLKFEKTELQTAYCEVIESTESFAAGESIANSLNKDGLKGILVLSDGQSVNGTELIRGLNSKIPNSVVVTGGLAGDGTNFKRTWVIKGGEPICNFVSALGFYGDSVKLGHGSKGGWDIFGPERKVTKSKNNVLFELDGKPALQLYKTYLGDRVSELPASALLFPLALRKDSDDNKSIVRTVLNIDEENQSMIFAGDIPEGHLVQLMRANFDRLIDGAAEAALMTKCESSTNSDSVLSIAISCVGRRLVLGERTEEELESTLDTLPENTKQIGFYSYGEISPYATGHCDLHNQTMTLTTVSEDE